jgi:hypothetical protein
MPRRLGLSAAARAAIAVAKTRRATAAAAILRFKASRSGARNFESGTSFCTPKSLLSLRE